MKQSIIAVAIILFSAVGMQAQIHLPDTKDSSTGLKIEQDHIIKYPLKYSAESADYQWYPFPSPSQEEVTQTSIAGDGSEVVVFYRQPNPSLNIDEGIVEEWTGSDWSVIAHATNQCHDPDIDIDGSLKVATWNDDSYDYGYGTNVNGPWVSLTGTYLTKQWFPRAAMAMGLPYMSFACKYSDGQATSYDMLHIKNIVGVGEEIELNGGWRVPYTSVGLKTDITGDDNAWYCVFSQQQFLYVMKGAVVNSEKEYTDLGDGFRRYNPASNPEIVLYNDTPVVGWFENGNTEIYIAQWNGSAWIVLGEGSVTAGSMYSLRMASSSSHLYVAYASTESDTAISINLWDGEQWYEMPPVQNQLNSDIGTVDIAVHNEEPVVSFTENKLLTVKKYTGNAITKNNEIFADPLSLICYPNPAYDMITVRTRTTGDCSMVITSMTGQIIQSRYFIGSYHTVDLTSYLKGVYFITVKTEGFVATRRIVKL